MEAYVSLLKEWQISQEAISKNVTILQSGMDAKAIHDLRVAIKKLRAYTKLLEEMDDTSNEDQLLPQTKALFDIVGIHREWDMMDEKLKKRSEEHKTSYPLYAKHIKQVKVTLETLVKEALASYNVEETREVERRIRSIINSMSSEELSLKCIGIIKKYINKVKRNSTRFDKKIHETRKLLKAIFYWIKLFPEESLYTKEQVEAIDEFLDKLGKWHDQQVMLDKIKCYRKNYLPKRVEEYNSIKELELDVREKQNRIYTKLNVKEMVEVLRSMQVK